MCMDAVVFNCKLIVYTLCADAVVESFALAS